MKKILFLAILAVVGYLVIKPISETKILKFFEKDITIAHMKENPSIYADSMITLKKVKVLETQCVLNFSKSTITDVSGAKVIYLSSKPCRTGEIIDITGKYFMVYKIINESCEVFIDENLKP